MEAAKAEEESAPPTTRVKRALEIDEQSPVQEVPVKRVRVDDLEREVWVDGRRGRALLGLAIGLGARYEFSSLFCANLKCYITLFGLDFFCVEGFRFLVCKIMDGVYIFMTVNKLCLEFVVSLGIQQTRM